uniref:hypothetical protein n=1 Tax=Acetatifactor sp. TaxID=1872090 RepID=UPI00405680F6
MERGFEIINLSATEKAVLKVTGGREVVANIKMIPGADAADNDWVMEELRNLYMRYYSRVAEYRNMEGI